MTQYWNPAGFGKPAAAVGDLVQRAFQRRSCDALTAVFLVDELRRSAPTSVPQLTSLG